MKNQEGQSGVELATADDVKCLLQDAMASQQNVTISPAAASNSRPVAVQTSTAQNQSETVIMPSGAAIALSVPVRIFLNYGPFIRFSISSNLIFLQLSSRVCLSPMPENECCFTEAVKSETAHVADTSSYTISSFLNRYEEY